jgi:hypothetical protein
MFNEELKWAGRMFSGSNLGPEINSHLGSPEYEAGTT